MTDPQKRIYDNGDVIVDLEHVVLIRKHLSALQTADHKYVVSHTNGIMTSMTIAQGESLLLAWMTYHDVR